MKHVPAIRMARSFGFIVAAVVLSGCGGPEHAGKAELPPPQVTVAPPTERTVTRYEFATGRCQPLEQVEVRARVNGYLRSVYFKQGKEIEKGTLMAEIDTDTYDADLARTKASLKTAEADEGAAAADLSRAMSRTDTTKKEYDRQDAAFKRGAASSKEFDKAKGDYDEAVSTQKSTAAKVKQAKAKIDEAAAAVRTADLNLGYCKIKAPISGLVGDRLITEGNLITGGMGNANLITTIVAVEKMDIGFDVSENTIQRIHKAMNDGKLKKIDLDTLPVEAGLAIHGTAYPLKGVFNFSDNQYDQKTGTRRVKGRFDNPKTPSGARVLAAGEYAHVRIPIGDPHKAMLVPDSAFGSDQGIRFLFLVGADNKAVRWDAQVGELEGTYRVVESISEPGEPKPRPLAPTDRVIVNGVQRVRPGMVVDPKEQAKK